ncbi:cytidylyltransferase domain-containing protein [Pararcticibacter amylolyticus]|uniref:Acylneuraminate cytidylyltransferase n=1 Tax=Pararcticibacter amylolyticus TaxID=2173175 RepID=A0A2U2PLQ3_9SPHI|nr:glycosyltransferase family protein [Pararcticibacter amylolyticus]PWG82337.1 acylneuraminate cytidylyltransferase [Pararcticibacter amylolyticus]
MKNIGIITQARMTSTRLPGKIFREAHGRPLLSYHIERLQKTGLDLAIATTLNSTDDCVSDFAAQNNLKVHRGSEENVLSRFYETATKHHFGLIVRVTSDCPLIDPHLIRNSIEKYLKINNENLYMSNAIERTFARGFDFEIFSFKLLEEAFLKAVDKADQEHVTPYIWKNTSGNTEFYHIKQDTDHSSLRITVDTPEDYELIKILIEKYQADKLDYHSIEELLIGHPELTSINADIEQKKV